ncbi:MAG: hypothetical protein NTX48_08090 [Planctomycetales bacterium]|nr:hypothetical protein [Planctomycetales bacterium]
MRTFLLLVFLSTLGNGTFAQQVGTPEGDLAIADMQRRAFLSAMAVEVSWRAARKISLLDPIPDVPQPRQHESLDLDTLQRGEIGKLSYWNFKVADIVDDKNVILILGSNRRIWLEGYPTSDIVDDQSVRIIDYIEVIGTKSYDTVDGSNATVWFVKLLPKEETAKRIAEDLEKAAEEATKRIAEDLEKAAEEAKYRQWKAKNGDTVNGKFLDYRNSKITIEQRDGKKIFLKMSALAKEERELVLKLAKEKSDKKLPTNK